MQNEDHLKTHHFPYWVLAYYKFTEIDDPHLEVKNHKEFIQDKEIKCRIYLSEEGINGQLSGSKSAVQEYMGWIQENSLFRDLHFKIHGSNEQVFAKQTVKYREQIVAMDLKADQKNSGKHVSPAQWREMIESDEEYLLLDVRNDYEWDVGHFEGAQKIECKTFREFPEYTRQLKKKVDPKKTKVMMCCTGGIRCEIFSSFMKEEGFNEVYQLDGGIINYGLKEGSQHWKGKLFVFDDRMTVPISDEETKAISTCNSCSKPADHYYNCANMDCNHLFLSCPECLEKAQGCCNSKCTTSPRVRPFSHQNGKPFRKWYQYIQEEERQSSRK